MKISDEAVEAACKDFYDEAWQMPDSKLASRRRARMRELLEAAAPYLEPAVPTKAELASWLRDIFSNDADPEGTTWEVAAEELQALLALHPAEPADTVQ